MNKLTPEDIEQHEFEEQLYILRTQVYQMRSVVEETVKALQWIEDNHRLKRIKKGQDASFRVPLKSTGRRIK